MFVYEVGGALMLIVVIIINPSTIITNININCMKNLNILLFLLIWIFYHII
jgi:hypothetical protein